MPNTLRQPVSLALMDKLSERYYEPSEERFQEALREDLSDLLNSRRKATEIPEQHRECAASILNFGLPDFIGLSLRSPSDRRYLEIEIERAIRLFEPRLNSVEVKLDENIPPGAPALKFKIRAWVQMDPAPIAVTLDTLLKSDSYEFVVNAQVRA